MGSSNGLSRSRMKMQVLARWRLWTVLVFVTAVWSAGSSANQVEVLKARFVESSSGDWNVSVTLRHDDTGWEHYADQWRVVDASTGKVLGSRVLFHPHEDEQPFTRSLSGVRIPSFGGSSPRIYVEAHDKVHGWSANRVPVDLDREAGEGYEVIRR